MTNSIHTASKRHSPAAMTAGIILTAALAFGTFAAPASAQHRGWERHDTRRNDWNGGYYRRPPVVYGTPYSTPYYAPPLIYGPGIGLNFNFR